MLAHVIVRRIGSDTEPLKDRFLVLQPQPRPTRSASSAGRWRPFCGAEVPRCRSGGYASDRSGSHPAAYQSARGGVRLKPFRGQEAGGDRRTEKGPRMPEPEAVPLRTGPVEGIYTLECQRAASDACLQALRTPDAFCPVPRSYLFVLNNSCSLVEQKSRHGRLVLR